MRLRTFTAETMKEALATVKSELGDNALILSSEEHEDYVQVVAAIDSDYDEINNKPETRKSVARESVARESEIRKPATKSQEKIRQLPPREIDNLRFAVQEILRFHNLPELFIAKLIATLNDATIAAILGRGRMNIANEQRYFLQLACEYAFSNYFNFSKSAKNISESPRRLMLIGTSGSGKTLATAKIATRQSLSGKKPLVITTDVNRAGGIDQLQSFTDILNLKLIVCSDKKSLLATLKMEDKNSNLLIDTSGCNPYSADDLKELATLAETAARAEIEPVLVMPAGIDTQEAIDIAERFCELPIKQLIITRLDCARRFGGVLAVAAANDMSLFLAGNSASVTDNMTELNPKKLVEYLFADNWK